MNGVQHPCTVEAENTQPLDGVGEMETNEIDDCAGVLAEDRIYEALKEKCSLNE